MLNQQNFFGNSIRNVLRFLIENCVEFESQTPQSMRFTSLFQAPHRQPQFFPDVCLAPPDAQHMHKLLHGG